MRVQRAYLIGNTHIDHTWVWNWTEGLNEVLASYAAALDRMEEFPEFVFTCSTSLHYRWVEEHAPELFARIRARVAEGRWQIAGGWVTQSDNNIPGGEAFVRQGLYAQRYFESRFGQRARVGYCVDSFGHNAQLPQILAGQGMVGWLHFRPSPHELELPEGPYRWRGIDGTEVVACRPAGWYCTPDENWFANAARQIEETGARHPEALFFFGVGDHGGGPTVRDLQWMRRYREEHPDLECVYGGLDAFYERAAGKLDDLPLVEGELQHCFRGCYTSNAHMKSLNRLAEGRLLTAETTAALALVACRATYPVSDLERAWEHLLTNHFHDVLCGTCAPGATDETVFRFGGVLETADRVRHPALKHLTARFDRRPPAPYAESLAVCVASALSWDRREPLSFVPHTPGRAIAHPAIVDADGRPVEFQRVEPDFGTPEGAKALLFSPEVPAGGIALYHVVERAESAPQDSSLEASETRLSSPRWEVTLGGDAPLTAAARAGQPLGRGQAPLLDLAVMRDLGDTWGTDRFRFGDRIGRFEGWRARALESGPLRARVELTGAYERSTARLVVSLYRDHDWLDLDIEVLWNDRLKTLKAVFALDVPSPRALYEIPYGAIERAPDGGEEPLQRWLQVTGGEHAVGFVTDNIGGVDVLAVPGGADVSFTVLRSPYYGYLTGADAVEGLERPVADQGMRRCRLRIVAGAVGDDLRLPERARELSQPLQVAFEGSRPGAARVPLSFLRCTPSSVHVGALKRAEDGDGLVVRLVETRGSATEARVEGPEGLPPIQTRLRPWEIQSWRWRSGQTPVRCNLLEETIR